MESTVERLDDHTVKLFVSVPAGEFERAIDGAFRKLAGEVRIPGFRPGKAPRKLLEARFGPEAAREQALRDSLPEYYLEAVNANDVDVIAAPEIEITAGEDSGDVRFEAVVEVRPEVRVHGYDALRVEIPWTAVDDEAVDRQVDAWRERFAELTPSEHPLTDDAYATIDIAATDAGEPVGALSAEAYLYRVGSGMLVPELDEQLRGTRPGAIVEFGATLPERFGDLAGHDVTFRVVVKEVQQKVLPAADDAWVKENTEFDTVEEMRADIRTRLDLLARAQGRITVRDKVLEAIADLVPVGAPEPLVDQEVRRRVEDFAQQLGHRGMQIEQYLAISGQEPQAFLDEIRVGATRAVLADLGLRAVIAQEQIAPSDEEVAEAAEREVARIAEASGAKPQKVRRDLDKRGFQEAVRSELTRARALELLVERAVVVDTEGAPVDLALPEEDGAVADRSSPEEGRPEA